MDNCGKGVVILAATNHPEAIDGSILRPGRLDRLVYVPPPTLDERVTILEILKKTTKFADNMDLRTVGNLTNNFTGADMKALVRKAGLYALKAKRVSKPLPKTTIPPLLLFLGALLQWIIGANIACPFHTFWRMLSIDMYRGTRLFLCHVRCSTIRESARITSL